MTEKKAVLTSPCGKVAVHFSWLDWGGLTVIPPPTIQILVRDVQRWHQEEIYFSSWPGFQVVKNNQMYPVDVGNARAIWYACIESKWVRSK